MQYLRIVITLGMLIILVGLGVVSQAQSDTVITGFVVDENGPVPDATVRVQTTTMATQTDDRGAFRLVVDSAGPFALTAWASGYYCSGPVHAAPGEQNVTLQLTPHTSQDNTDYAWLPSGHSNGTGEDQGCAACHSAAGTTLSYTLPFDEWAQDVHSQTATNERFLTMYLGTDVDGNQSPPTRYIDVIDYGTRPLPPDPNQPYYGPGYKLDFPGSAGNCAACHTPAAAIDNPYSVNPTTLEGVDAEGIPCDFCHKIWDVRLDPASGLPLPNMPGVLSYTYRRPPDGHQFFAGPFDDVAPGEDTYSALQTESAFCAGCHFGVFWDVVIYNSFGEWLASPYSDPATGRTCQDCHMPPSGAPFFAHPDQGGLRRDPQTIFSHRMPGAVDEQLLQDTIDMTVDVERQGDSVAVEVTLVNSGAGHHVPTDSPLRQMLLIVTAQDANGHPLTQRSGDTLPLWTGALAGEAGSYFALILEEVWTGISPTGAYWNPTRIVEDTRLPALATSQTQYVFAASDHAPFHINVHVVLRRAFADIMESKGWTMPDMPVARTEIVMP